MCGEKFGGIGWCMWFVLWFYGVDVSVWCY